MLSCLPSIVVDDVAPPASKRRRLNTPHAERIAIEDLCNGSEYTHSADTTPVPSPICIAAEEIYEGTLVCCGMISDLTVNVSLHHLTSDVSPQHSIYFQPPRTLSCAVADAPVGLLDDFAGELLLRLVDDDDLILQFLLSSTPIASATERKSANKNSSKYLGVILYGPRCRLGDVGDFMTQAGCYLDDPVGCDRNVPYMNPQCLFSLHEQPPMTFDLLQPRQLYIDNYSRASLDVLSGFETTDDLELSATPTALRTELKLREQGMHPNKDGFGVWLRKWSEGKPSFVNAMTAEAKSTPGPIWRGGLLADEMGLGKTLSMIALIASDQDSTSNDKSFTGPPIHGAPIIRSHLHDGKLTWFMHHGRQRFKLKSKEVLPDIVFTTYQTIEREYRNRAQGSSSLLSHYWRRVILDEAHTIRNHNTSTAQAITALQATSRWAVSGTPIQNSLLDFYGLFKFLHFSPYDDPSVFDDDVTNLWRVKPAEEAAEAFKKLLSCVMIRRTKAILDLPSRDDKLIRVPFSHEEEKHYRQIEQPVVDMLDRATESGCQTNRTDLMNARYLMGGELCAQCLQPVEASVSGDGLRDACSIFYCAECSALLRYQSPDPCECTEQPRPCQIRPLASFLPTPRLTPVGDLSPLPMEWDHTNDISSKVWTLVSQIRSCPNEKHVVFSSWTSSLDMVEKALRFRIDGKVQLKNRSHAIQQLHHNPSIRVILITIACGAWQTRPVTTIRYVMEDSFEEVLESEQLLSTKACDIS
ncbi:SNF2 family N-terminal domain-containing protein [Bipolaris maydis]|nr:SNF2 family N-terminal domain-containing protein [Bipolaris maydis]